MSGWVYAPATGATVLIELLQRRRHAWRRHRRNTDEADPKTVRGDVGPAEKEVRRLCAKALDEPGRQGEDRRSRAETEHE
jgi:hypothetical protein